MFTAFGRMLARSITRSNVGLYPSYQLPARMVHHLQKVTNASRVSCANYESFKINPTCVELTVKPPPVKDPEYNKISQVFDLPFPFSRVPLPPDMLDPLPDLEIIEPYRDKIEEKQAARLIVIRRRKMKKHKLRKLRKKMKFEWAKVRQRRELKKEKLFQATLISQIKDAEKFDAGQYVSEKLKRVREFNELKKKPHKVVTPKN